jgi:hypothetical protein
MTAPEASGHQALDRPACTPSAIRAVLAANEQACQAGELTPLVQTVRRWWFEADACRDPEAQREFVARVVRYQREGPPPSAERISWEEIRAQYGGAGGVDHA